MRKIILNILAICLIGCTVPVQEKQEVTITTNDTAERRLILIPMGYDEGAIDMTVEGTLTVPPRPPAPRDSTTWCPSKAIHKPSCLTMCR